MKPFLWAAALGVALGTPAVLQPQGGPPGLFGELETTLVREANIRAALQRGRIELITVMRRYPPAPKSWQIDPVLVNQLNDGEVFEYVARRAEATLTCGLDLYSRIPIQKLEEITEIPSPPRTLSFKGSAVVEGLTVTDDCSVLTNTEGDPVRLRTPAEYARFQALWAGFTPRRAASTAVLSSNLAYLRKAAGDAISDEPEIRQILADLGITAVRSRPVANLITYVGTARNEQKLVFVAPLAQ